LWQSCESLNELQRVFRRAKLAAFCLIATAVALDQRGCDKAEAPERRARALGRKSGYR
jgi:hypothetical protein